MSLSRRPISYCTNVHPGLSLGEVLAGLDRYAIGVRERLGREMAVGLWLAEPVVREIRQSPNGPARLADELQRRGLPCYTLNAFPYGDFHSERVKETVYRPDWADPERRRYTEGCAEILAALLPEGGAGSISTVPLGFKGDPHRPAPERPADFEPQAIAELIAVARRLGRLHAESGRRIGLAIEPEPLCLLETTDETLAFFERLWTAADRCGAADAVRRHLGVCFDVCHQAVEFEDVGESLRRLDGAGVPIFKVHISCAIHIDRPGSDPSARAALARYAEPRYLHQTFARLADGCVIRHLDLSEQLALQPTGVLAEAEAWRVHFHVPVDAARLGPLGTTREELRQALETVAVLETTPDLEVETYTWEVLPGRERSDLADGLARELSATYALLDKINEGERGA
jgi:sugar phosphate isomerase/epimerase